MGQTCVASLDNFFVMTFIRPNPITLLCMEIVCVEKKKTKNKLSESLNGLVVNCIGWSLSKCTFVQVDKDCIVATQLIMLAFKHVLTHLPVWFRPKRNQTSFAEERAVPAILSAVN